MNDEVLFKYRSIQNWKYLLDIFLHKRLYAAAYRELNDPMEGRYYYHSDEVSNEFRRALRNLKHEWRICSLSRNHRNTLMWSYYADGHRGIAIGIKVRDAARHAYTIREVSYDMEVDAGDPKLRKNLAQVALHILSQKQMAWQHEDEVRVFSREPFVKVDIQKVCFGCNSSRTDRELITALARMTAPEAKLVKLQRKQLDKPLETFRH
jgi:hypothetical protein